MVEARDTEHYKKCIFLLLDLRQIVRGAIDRIGNKRISDRKVEITSFLLDDSDRSFGHKKIKKALTKDRGV